MSNQKKVAVLGLGQMGAAIAGNLLKAGYPLVVWNRSRDKTQPLVERGARAVSTPAQAAGEAEVVITMLSDDAALNQVVHGPEGIAGALKPSSVHVSMSTIAPTTAQSIADDHAPRQIGFVAAPVFGKPDAAAAAKLVICCSGEPAAKSRVSGLFEVLGHKVVDFGPSPAAAPTVKLAGNFMIGAAIEAMAEAFTLAEKTGISRQQINELFSLTLFACPVYQNYGRMISTHHYQPAGAAPALIRKDMRLVLEHAGRQQTPMPLASLIHDRLTATVAKGAKDVDWTAFAREVSISAGLTI